MAPQSGHVSNFCEPIGTLIEPVNAQCFQSDRMETLLPVHAGPPPWTRLELGNRQRMRTQPCAFLLLDRIEADFSGAPYNGQMVFLREG